jgi:hypothetical protein
MWMWKMKLSQLIIPLSIAVFLLMHIVIVNADESSQPMDKKVSIAPNAIGVPLGNILLMRKNNVYGAVRFTQCWTGKTEFEQHAEYESFYQGDKSGDFSKSNVKYRKEEVFYKKPSFSIFGHPISIGDKKDIRFGPVELWWSALNCVAFVYFNRHDKKQGDYYDIELAPTKWSKISEVNVFDRRLTWYRFDESRKRIAIPLDQLWDDEEDNGR